MNLFGVLANAIRCVLILLIIHLPTISHAAQAEAMLSKVTVAYLYQISKFVHWPADSFEDNASSIVICHVATKEESLQPYLGWLKSKTSQGRPIDTLWFNTIRAVKEFYDKSKVCHMLFFSGNLWQTLPTEEVRRFSLTTLMIGNSREFLKHQGMMALIPTRSKLRLYVNLPSVKQSRLALEARLLALAKSI